MLVSGDRYVQVGPGMLNKFRLPETIFLILVKNSGDKATLTAAQIWSTIRGSMAAGGREHATCGYDFINGLVT